MFEVNSPEKNTSSGKGLVSKAEHMQVPNGTGPGVRRSKRPLSACYIHRKCSRETSHKSVKSRFRIGIKSNRWRVVIAFGLATECH